MSRVHCSACGTAVVVDPTGLCPDGHHVGAAGARVASAMGSGSPHADEPEPWVAQVVLDDDPSPTAATPRRARPVSVPGIEVADDTDQESLLQELHALAEFDLDGLGGGSPTIGEPAASQGATPQTPEAPPATPSAAAREASAPSDWSEQLGHTGQPPHPGQGPAEPTVPGRDAEPDAQQPAPAFEPVRGDELAALEAALHELSLPDDAVPAPARTNGSAPTGSDTPGQLDGLAGLAELDELFSAAPSTPPTPGPTDPAHRSDRADPGGPPDHAHRSDHAAPGGPSDHADQSDQAARDARRADAGPHLAESPAMTPVPAAPSAPAAGEQPPAAPAPVAGQQPPTAPPTTPPTTPPTAAPLPAASAPDPDLPSPSVEDSYLDADRAAAGAPAPANLDITNFTAKGGKVGGRKRRFGR